MRGTSVSRWAIMIFTVLTICAAMQTAELNALDKKLREVGELGREVAERRAELEERGLQVREHRQSLTATSAI